MVLNIPLICIALGLVFLILIYAEIRVKAQGIFAGVGVIVNIVAVVILFRLGTELESILLFLLCEIVIAFALVFSLKEGNDAI